MVGGTYNGCRRASYSPVLQQYSPATHIANVRQISIVSQEDIDHTGLAMGIAEFNPPRWGTNLVVTGCNDFSYILPFHGSKPVTVQRLL